ncbi:hypothetical protein ALC53_03396 [Atta colombica]|uniref:Uncharacterized protein n=1 Tax=Atta colombica TaxID=520822 RepID=A0A195BPS7_9HYME|nr:hypothetical protein ALC53_03396 [Atta colombica]
MEIESVFHGEMPRVQSAELVNEPWRMAARKGLHKMEYHNRYNTRGIISAFNTRSRKKASKRKKKRGGGSGDDGSGGGSSGDSGGVLVHKCIGTTETYEPKVRGRADADTAPKGYVRANQRTRTDYRGGWKDVDTCVLVEERRAVPCSRSSLPGELEFLAADRILSRESRDARLATIYATSWASRCAGALYIHNVIHQNVVMRLIVYRCPSESSGMYFPKRNGNANDLFAPLRYIVIDAGHHRIDVTNVGGCSDH